MVVEWRAAGMVHSSSPGTIMRVHKDQQAPTSQVHQNDLRSVSNTSQRDQETLQLEVTKSRVEGAAIEQALSERRKQVQQQASEIETLEEDVRSLEARLASAIMPEDPSEVCGSFRARSLAASEEEDEPLSLEAVKQQLEILPQLHHQVITLEEELAGRVSEAAALNTKLKALRS